jgi:hypothetical protein
MSVDLQKDLLVHQSLNKRVTTFLLLESGGMTMRVKGPAGVSVVIFSPEDRNALADFLKPSPD